MVAKKWLQRPLFNKQGFFKTFRNNLNLHSFSKHFMFLKYTSLTFQYNYFQVFFANSIVKILHSEFQALASNQKTDQKKQTSLLNITANTG